jgi:cystathionine beta-synthase
VDNPALIDTPISGIMQKAFPIVHANTSIEEVSKLINKDTPAVLVELPNGKFHIVSRQDIISSLA